MNNLANAYRDAGRPTEAAALHEETLQRREAKLGPDHPDTLLSMSNVASAYQNTGRPAEALRLFEEALKRMKAKLGPDHRHTLLTMSNLATLHAEGRKYDLAKTLLYAVLEVRRGQLGPEHPHVAAALAVLGRIELEQMDFGEAELLLRECLSIQVKKRPFHWQRFNTMSLLGGALLGQKKYAEAEPLLVQGYEGLKSEESTTPVPEKRHLTVALKQLVQLYDAWEQKDQADAWRKELNGLKKN